MASIGADTLGFCTFEFIPYQEKESFAAFLVCSSAMTMGFLLSVTACTMSRERDAARHAVLVGSVAVAVVNLLGLVWLFITKSHYSL
jgi:hypothetical protein